MLQMILLYWYIFIFYFEFNIATSLGTRDVFIHMGVSYGIDK